MRLLIASAVGPLLAEYDVDALTSLRYWQQSAHPPAGTRDEPARGDALGAEIARQLSDYFVGARRDFELPLRPEGTSFQQVIWTALRRIPFGETRSYAEVARDAGRPGAARAVGQANRNNPIPLIIPCHRVLAADGGIGGYMGTWGDGSAVDIKRWLLKHERTSRVDS